MLGHIRKQSIKSLTGAILVALSGILGALGGALVTGHYMIRAQELQYQQAARKITSANAQIELEKLRDISLDFFMNAHRTMESISASSDESELESSQLQRLNESAYALILYSDPPLAEKTASLYQSLLAFQSAVGTDCFEDKESAVLEAFGEWFVEFRLQVASYRAQTMPEKVERDFLIAILRGMGQD